ncbi:unnamed protein product [Thelazia callipaeda]|uniref:Secreted protein n=1 Tax=Thelazia callipaeda TaxID=103827 RepID=A0A0N5CU15_THECL|nr:unnamed protein product [Thelazia callipaeda]
MFFWNFCFIASDFIYVFISNLTNSWSTRLDERNDRVRILPFRRPTRNSGNGDEARYQIRHVGDLPMFRFG